MNIINDSVAASPVYAEATRSTTRRTVIAAALGNGLEFFDFTVYSFFAILIGKLFFPLGNELDALMLSLATFGVGFVARPLGSVMIGAYADRAGRKSALTLTIGLMALGTGVIGLAPTYATIGLAAPMLIVCGRLLQGFRVPCDSRPPVDLPGDDGRRRLERADYVVQPSRIRDDSWRI